MDICKGAWMAQLAKHPIFDFSLGLDLMVREIKPYITLHAERVEPTWDSLSLPLSLPLPCLHSLNKQLSRLKKNLKMGICRI